jgi:NADH:ubiquinone oxidoreductase subunit 2 (subunit N)
MLTSVVSAFLYLRIVVAMYMQGDEEGADEGRPRIRVPATAAVSLGIALAVTIVIGVLPGVAVDWARDAVPVLVAGP